MIQLMVLPQDTILPKNSEKLNGRSISPGDPLKESLDTLLAQVSDWVDVQIGDLLKEHGRLNTVTEVDKGIAYSSLGGQPPKAHGIQIYLCPNGSHACQAVTECSYHTGFKRYGSESIPTCPHTGQPLQLFTEL